MLRIFNTKALSQNERYIRAIVIGILSALIFSLLYGLVTRLIGIQISILYVVIGFGLSTIIKNQGRGVQMKFSYLGGALTLLSIFIGDMIVFAGISAFTNFDIFIEISLVVFRFWLSTSFNNLLGLLIRIYAIYYAYNNSRIV